MELAKCQVLCGICHKEKSDEASRRPVQHGTHTGYSHYNCRCVPCVTAQADYQRAWRDRVKKQ